GVVVTRLGAFAMESGDAVEGIALLLARDTGERVRVEVSGLGSRVARGLHSGEHQPLEEALCLVAREGSSALLARMLFCAVDPFGRRVGGRGLRAGARDKEYSEGENEKVDAHGCGLLTHLQAPRNSPRGTAPLSGHDGRSTAALIASRGPRRR